MIEVRAFHGCSIFNIHIKIRKGISHEKEINLFNIFCDHFGGIIFAGFHHGTHLHGCRQHILGSARQDQDHESFPGGDTVLYWPDSVLVLDQVSGIPDIQGDAREFRVFQNYPNPAEGRTTLSFYVPGKGQVGLSLSDNIGRVLFINDKVLNQGFHTFSLVPGSAGLLFFTARWKEEERSIKILSTGNGGNENVSLEYLGSSAGSEVLKTEKSVQEGFTFLPGDTLLYIGYVGNL
jgi:hypothetical protein